MTSPRNTSKMDTADVLGMALGGSEAIYAQEAQGQCEMLKATTLPTDTYGSDPEFEALGFKFGKIVVDDPLFRETTLPDGWSRQGTEHSMWTTIVDERGLERVGVFYKAAFYDRKAAMNLVNVGSKVSSSFIYGDAETPVLHPELTDEELADVRADAESYLKRAREYPDIYGDRLPRAKAILQALDEREAA